jgi:hypothetical protein
VRGPSLVAGKEGGEAPFFTGMNREQCFEDQLEGPSGLTFDFYFCNYLVSFALASTL